MANRNETVITKVSRLKHLNQHTFIVCGKNRSNYKQNSVLTASEGEVAVI